MSEWTLERELCQLSGADHLEPALQKLEVLRQDERLGECVVRQEWTRGGAETHIYCFDVRTSSGRLVPLILKAYTPPVGPTSIDEGLRELLERRRLLRAHGVSVPKLYYSGQGVTLEDFVPFLLKDTIAQLREDDNRLFGIVVQLFAIAMTLDRLGFAPVSPLHDLRTDGERVFLIDFGEDLGPPIRAPVPRHSEELVLRWLRDASVFLPDQTIQRARAAAAGVAARAN